MERAPAAGLGFGPDASAVALDDFAAGCQSQTRRERFENAAETGSLNLWAVVLNGKEPTCRVRTSGYVGSRSDLTPVAQQVFEELHEPVGVARDARQVAVCHLSPIFAEILFQLGQGASE